MDIDTEYRNQEELYRRIVNQHGHNCFKIEDTGTSYELVNKIFPITIELPTQIVFCLKCMTTWGIYQNR